MNLEIEELSPIGFLMAYGFKLMQNDKGKKIIVHIEVPSESIKSEIDKIMAGTDTEIDYFSSGRNTTLTNDKMKIIILEVF